MCVVVLQEPIPTSLLRLAPEHAARAVKMFAGILRYCGDAPGSEGINQSQAIETAQKLLHQVGSLRLTYANAMPT